MLEKIDNPFSRLPHYHCFGCSPDNKMGMRLEFLKDSDKIVAFYTPPDYHSGMPKVLHGGLSAVMLDEIMFWSIFVFQKRVCFTTDMSVKYKKIIPTGEKIELHGMVLENKRRFFIARGELLNLQGEVLCSAEATYFAADRQKFLQAFGVEALPEEFNPYF